MRTTQTAFLANQNEKKWDKLSKISKVLSNFARASHLYLTLVSMTNDTNLHEPLKRYFGFETFRNNQEAIIRSLMAGHDVFVLMPTGGGKSVCYQIPAALLPGLTIVVSPLISLMKDQVESLLEAGIPARAINSSLPLEQSVQLQEACVNGKYKLVYLSPEALLASLHGWISRAKISLIAIDEAHCISQWGHDFRPEYTQLGQIRRGLPDVPMMALTATADKVTREDILKQLGLHNPYISVSSFDRPNLSLTIIRGFNGSEKLKAILRFLRERPGQAGIIYCMSRKTTESVAEKLTAKGVRALSYHAGLSADVRDKTQTAFINDDVQIIVATVAFGMGIDKSNVRYVLHYQMPKSMETYYQEAGRAGRDGAKAECILSGDRTCWARWRPCRHTPILQLCRHHSARTFRSG